MTIIKPSTAFKAGADWVSAEVRAYIKDQVATHVDTVADVRDNDFEQTRFVYVRSKATLYRLDLSSGADDDGDTVLRDNMGRRYVKVAGSTMSLLGIPQVDDLTARGAYDNEDPGFMVLVSDTGSGRAAIYTMGDGGSGDWSEPAYLTPASVGGDVVGPASATDGNVPVFDGTTGKLVKDSGKSLADLQPTGNYLKDALINLLPDSGRFAADKGIAIGAFAAPSYIDAFNSTTKTSFGKFLNNNNDYGGSAGSMDPVVKQLIDRIRASGVRRYGPEFHVMQMTMGSGTGLPYPSGGDTYYLSATFASSPRPPSQTLHYYLRLLDAPLLVIREGSQQVYLVDGVPQPAGHFVVPATGDWVSITLYDATDPYNSFGYIPRPLMLAAKNEGDRYLIACPALLPGIVPVDDNVGMVPGFNTWL